MGPVLTGPSASVKRTEAVRILRLQLLPYQYLGEVAPFEPGAERRRSFTFDHDISYLVFLFVLARNGVQV